jgi:hypothetical protein
MYIGIREGAPCPIMQMNVGVGRRRRDSGVMEEVRVRMYSWQFCYDHNLAVSFFVSSDGERGGGRTPQKKCRMKIMRTRRVTPGPV